AEPKKTTFTIGDRSQSSGGIYTRSVENVPLVMGNRYQVTLVAVNQWENNYSISSVRLNKLVKSGYGEDDTTNDGSVAGWVILVLLLICIPIVLYFILK
ncbi:hypothetical protein L9F63_019034, partial [Diploptera punctata]